MWSLGAGVQYNREKKQKSKNQKKIFKKVPENKVLFAGTVPPNNSILIKMWNSLPQKPYLTKTGLKRIRKN